MHMIGSLRAPLMIICATRVWNTGRFSILGTSGSGLTPVQKLGAARRTLSDMHMS